MLKLSWFQKLIVAFLTFISSLNGLKQSIDYGIGVGSYAGAIGHVLGYAIGSAFIILLFMWLYNKFMAKRVKTNNLFLKKCWRIIQIIVACLMVIWFLLFVYGVLITL